MATKFSELGIKQAGGKEFKGEKIEIFEVFKKEIIIHHFRIVEGKYPKKGCDQRLDMQITIDGKLRMLWTSSLNLIRTIEQVPEDKFPLLTTIIKTDNKRFEFT